VIVLYCIKFGQTTVPDELRLATKDLELIYFNRFIHFLFMDDWMKPWKKKLYCRKLRNCSSASETFSFDPLSIVLSKWISKFEIVTVTGYTVLLVKG